MGAVLNKYKPVNPDERDDVKSRKKTAEPDKKKLSKWFIFSKRNSAPKSDGIHLIKGARYFIAPGATMLISSRAIEIARKLNYDRFKFISKFHNKSPNRYNRSTKKKSKHTKRQILSCRTKRLRRGYRKVKIRKVAKKTTRRYYAAMDNTQRKRKIARYKIVSKRREKTKSKCSPKKDINKVSIEDNVVSKDVEQNEEVKENPGVLHDVSKDGEGSHLKVKESGSIYNRIIKRASRPVSRRGNYRTRRQTYRAYRRFRNRSKYRKRRRCTYRRRRNMPIRRKRRIRNPLRISQRRISQMAKRFNRNHTKAKICELSSRSRRSKHRSRLCHRSLYKSKRLLLPRNKHNKRSKNFSRKPIRHVFLGVSNQPARRRSPLSRRNQPARRRSPLNRRNQPARRRSPLSRRNQAARHRSPLCRRNQPARRRSPLSRRNQPARRRSPLSRRNQPARRRSPLSRRNQPARRRSFSRFNSRRQRLSRVKTRRARMK